MGRVRAAFSPDRRVLPSRRLSFEARVGRVGRRYLGRTAACRKSSRRRSRPAWRFIIRERCSWATMTITSSPLKRDPAKGRRRAFTSSGKASDPPMSNRSSTAVLVLLTCCPPGPLARTARSTISSLAPASQKGSVGPRLRRRSLGTHGRAGEARRAMPRRPQYPGWFAPAPHPDWPRRRSEHCLGRLTAP